MAPLQNEKEEQESGSLNMYRALRLGTGGRLWLGCRPLKETIRSLFVPSGESFLRPKSRNFRRLRLGADAKAE